MIPGGPGFDPDFVRRTLTAYTQQYAGLAALFALHTVPGGPAFDALRLPVTGTYQHLFTPAGPTPLDAAAAGGPAFLRWQRASERYGTLVGAIANDAFARLCRALEDGGPDSAPISTLAALHTLWIDCGEAAWALAAHREEFAEAQAELLAALAGLKAAAGGR
jgi:Poly(R)-hydroxyalkanoic acid synthase subunit (PHA_synth_III_E)